MRSLPRRGLTLRRRLEHAIRVRSLKSGLLAVADRILGILAPAFWRDRAPWYAGRSLKLLKSSVRLDGNKYVVPKNEQAEWFQGLLWLERYEVCERYAALKWLDPALPVIELGAAIGVVSCLVNSGLRERTRHICVEANPALIPVLRQNREHNGCQFVIKHGALAYGAVSVQFGVSDAFVESSTMARNAAHWVEVPAVQLERVLVDAAIEECSLICDIEGTELDLVAREGDCLRRRVRTIVLEVHPEQLGSDGINTLRDELARLGFAEQWRMDDVWVMRQAGSLTDLPA
jgi:FkbM family methyltransferase